MPDALVAVRDLVRRTSVSILALLLIVLCPVERSSTLSSTWLPLAADAASPVALTGDSDRAVDEMLRGSKGRIEQWTTAPELVILTSVMQFRGGGTTSYVATADVLTDAEVAEMVTDLTEALRLLTAETFDHFAAVRQEAVTPGTSVRVIRRNQIVAGRFRGVQQQTGNLGFGGRSADADGAITGAALLLDHEYDRTGPMRARLRTHELGHALGFNHVQSRESIMNPRIGPLPNELDRQIATLAYRRAM